MRKAVLWPKKLYPPCARRRHLVLSTHYLTAMVVMSLKPGVSMLEPLYGTAQLWAYFSLSYMQHMALVSFVSQ